MNKIDQRIKKTQAQWRRYRYETIGVKQSGRLFCAALKRSMKKRAGSVAKNLQAGMQKASFEPTYDPDRVNIVISLTSTPDRIRYIFPTLYSVIRQTQKPDLIVLWLGEGKNFSGKVIQKIEKMGIRIAYREDLGPYTKYYYAFAAYKNDCVITVDDDMIYHKNMVRELLQTFRSHPDAVIARRVNKMRFRKDHTLTKYKNWIWEFRNAKAPAFDLLATGVGGVLYSPAVMAQKGWDDQAFLKAAPGCDDIWLKFNQLQHGVKVCAVRNSGFVYDVVNPAGQKRNLASGNVDGGRNDEAIKACTAYFGMQKDLCERILGYEYS